MQRKKDVQDKFTRKDYEKKLRKLQAELCVLQDWVKHKGLRIILVFEGRDGAGKGGTIRAITERVSPRVFRVVALPAPSDREKSQMYIQRYMQHFPAAGEIVGSDQPGGTGADDACQQPDTGKKDCGLRQGRRKNGGAEMRPETFRPLQGLRDQPQDRHHGATNRQHGDAQPPDGR